ncbi:MAG: BlaI/MecI/CopY family transcriptional regulator [Gammaproteobacteria bacterium]
MVDYYVRMRKPGIRWHTPPLGALEVRVLKTVWALVEADAKAVQSALQDEHAVSLSTVQSTLERLCRKQLLLRSKIGHAYCYTAGVKRGALIGDSIGEVIAALGRGELQPLMSSFVELADDADRETLDRLQQWVDAQSRRGGGSTEEPES